MFDNLEPLDSTRHKNLRFRTVSDCRFAAGVHSVPLSASEAGMAAKAFPITFAPGDAAPPMALLSLREGENAFVGEDGTWLADYLPAHIRRYPFMLGETDQAGTFAVMIDRDAPHFADAGGEPLYDEAGGNGPLLESAMEFLRVFQQEIDVTRNLVAALMEKNVLIEQQLTVSHADGTQASFAGVRVVDMEAVKALDDATLAAWVRNGLMGLIVAHLHSIDNIRALTRRQGPATVAARQEGEMPADPIRLPPRKPFTLTRPQR